MWRSKSKDRGLDQSYPIVQTFEGEGGRILQLFGEGGVPDWREIRQGNILDDWFLAAVISISRIPQRILKIVLQPAMNVQEVLGFCMNSVGIWAIIDVDESIPFFKIPKPDCSKHLFHKMKLSELVKSLDT